LAAGQNRRRKVSGDPSAAGHLPEVLAQQRSAEPTPEAMSSHIFGLIALLILSVK
jgi:hypothetical protein